LHPPVNDHGLMPYVSAERGMISEHSDHPCGREHHNASITISSTAPYC